MDDEKKLIKNNDKLIRDDNNHSVNEKWVKECEKYITKHLGRELEKINGVFSPGDDFYVNGKPGEVLIYMADQILKWLNIELKKDELVIVFYDGMDSPGLYTEIDAKKYILVDSKYSNDVFTMGAILAHELMHFYLIGRKNLRIDNTLENELLTDLCTIKFGLGLPIINGMSYNNSWFASFLFLFVGVFHWSSNKLSFGYFNPNQYGNLVYNNLKDKKITIEEIGGYVRPSSRTFLPNGIGLFWMVKKQSNYIHSIVKRHRIWTTIKLFIIILIIATGIWFSIKEENKKAELLEQKIYIERLEDYVLKHENEARIIMDELTNMGEILAEYEKNGNDDAYNKLSVKFLVKMKDAKYYMKLLNEYDDQIEDYNSKLSL